MRSSETDIRLLRNLRFRLISEKAQRSKTPILVADASCNPWCVAPQSLSCACKGRSIRFSRFHATYDAVRLSNLWINLRQTAVERRAGTSRAFGQPFSVSAEKRRQTTLY